MVHVVDAVDDGVAHVEVAAGQVNFGPEGHGTVGKLPGAHTLEQIQTLLHRTIPVGGYGGHTNVAPIGLEFLRSQLAHIGQTFFDEQHRLAVVLLKVVAAIEETVAPVKTQPVDILLDGLHELLILLGGVGVVHAQIAETAELFRGAEIDTQGLTVADVQVAVGLRRETGVDRHPLVLAPGRKILRDEIVNKVAALAALRLLGGDRDLVFLTHVVLLLIENVDCVKSPCYYTVFG